MVPADEVPIGQPDPNTSPLKRLYFLYYYLPKLRQRLEQRFIADTVSAAMGLSVDVTDALLSEALSAGTSTLSAMAALQSIKEKPAAVSGWKGYLIPPANGSYTFVASVSDSNPDTPPAPLTIEGFPEQLMFVYQLADPTNIWSTDPVPLKAGKLYLLTITDQDAAQLQWRTTASPATPIPTSALLPDFTNEGTKDILIKLCKATIVVNGFNLNADEVGYFQTHGADFDNFDFNSMTLGSWQRIAAYAALRNALPKAGAPLLDLFAWASQPQPRVRARNAELIKELVAVTQWDVTRIKALIANDHFDLNQREHFKNEVNLVRMQKAIAVADKVGVDIGRLFNWAVPGSKFWPCHTIAEDIRMATRARFDAKDWEQAVKPLSDQLREMQKQALISFLLVQTDLIAWPVLDADSLFEFFLIDVQMGAERQTSRMVQAIASVQLFIKRCLMGLEERKYGIPVDAIDRDRWEWMQKYRVWEANRKVFLYPENWIRPELRDDKSPFYKELESELLQKDINTQTVEEALKNYLYKVDEVANLQVVGLYIEPVTDKYGKVFKNDEGKTIYTKLHVFARTRNAPYFFFYRYYDISEGNWYPWGKMQVDIPSYDVEDVDEKTGKIKENGTYLIPVVWNNRLMVFFPQFMKKTIAASSDKSVRDMAESNSNKLKPTELWEIKMAWSEYRKGKWTQKQISTEAIYNPIAPGAQISSYMFFPTIISDPPKVALDIYHKKSAAPEPEPKPKPILLAGAILETKSVFGAIKGIDVYVTSLISGSLIASMTYDPNNTHPYKGDDTFDLGIKPNITKDQCKNFRVDIIFSHPEEFKPPQFAFDATVTLSFSDPTSDQLTVERKAISGGIAPPPSVNIISPVHFAYTEPEGPKLDSASLHFDIPKGDPGKNAEIWLKVSVKNLNGFELASLPDGGRGTAYAFGIDTEGFDLPLKEIRALTQAECQCFDVTITQYVPFQNDPNKSPSWAFHARATLFFQNDQSTLQANTPDKVTLNGNGDKIIFASTEFYEPPKEPDDQQQDDHQDDVPDDTITQRFEFLGNRFCVVGIESGDPVQSLVLQGYHFHYEDGEDWRLIHSLQAEDNEAPALINSEPCFEDPQPRFNDTDAQLAITEQQSYTFSYLSIYKLLSALNTDQIGNLYKYYLTLYDINDSTKEKMADVYGAYYDDKGQPSYHELKRLYSLYNWEVCFHAPMQLVDRMLTSQQFDQAIAMCHYIFNPLAKPVDKEDITQRCWQFPPFKQIMKDGIAKNVLETIFQSLKPNQPDSANGINEWRDKPFLPHSVARDRPSSYMKYVVMKYIEILIAYGDYYFRQSTMESIPLAIQCYVMASHLYGPRGEKIPRRGKIEKQTYHSLLDKWDAFGNAMVEMELEFPFSNQTSVGFSSAGVGLANVFGSVTSLYFSIPDNPNLTALRDTIDDRLLKIRSCENIEGIFQQLPLFEPPIDPALLVQAAAQGLSLSSVLNDMNSPMPNYRFYYLLQKALELCGELKSLGNAFLSTKEKGDAEALSIMRAKHESGIQNLVMEVRKQQLEEANKSLEALLQIRKGPESRMRYYVQLIGEDLSTVPDDKTDFSDLPNQLEKPLDESGLKLIRYEKEEMDRASEARWLQVGVGVAETLASIMHLIPDFSLDLKYLGIGAGTLWGGVNLGNAAQAIAQGLQIGASDLSYQSTNAGRKGGFLRQLQDRVQQANAAGYEIKNIDKQILTQQIRIALANQEIANQQRQIDNAQEVEDFLRSKYTNEELYSWMEGEIRTLYYQAYTLAYDLAKKVEKTYRFERGLSESNFIQFGYWDAGRDGLLVGERLYLALKQLEAAYQEKRGYDFEITKQVSLRQLDPLALIQLRETGKCEFVIPEVLFDMDHPGHYMRRIKSVALTVPCVVGPYIGLNCTLRLLEHKFRTNAIVSPSYAETKDETDERFSTVNVPITSIAVSNGQNDSGVFELNFHDERYIPFEGAGAISKWRMELPNEFRQFDYDTISDVILHLCYTSVDGGDNLKRAAVASVQGFISSVDELSREEGLFAVFDLKHDFSNEWCEAMQPTANATERVLSLNKLYDRLPIFTKGYQPENIIAIDAYLFTSNGVPTPTLIRKYMTNGAETTEDFFAFTGMPLASKDNNISMDNWQLTIPDGATTIEKMWLVVRYVLT
jgi:hypothetical protein